MKVVLTSGDSIKVSLEAFRLYKKRSGLDLYAYDLDTGESHDYRALLARIDDDEVFGYEPDYVICNKDLGAGAYQDDVKANIAEGCFDDPTDPILISVIEELGHKAIGYTLLGVIEIPDEIEWHINRGLNLVKMPWHAD